MDNISFTGINNLFIGKKAYSKFGSYITPYGNIQQGDKAVSEILIRCNLTDDFNGKHLSEFREALNKCDEHYRQNCINPNYPDKIRLFVRNFKIDDITPISFSNFKINGCEILLHNRNTLPLYTYMAKLTRQIQQLPDISEGQQYYARLFNKNVHTTACEFIDKG